MTLEELWQAALCEIELSISKANFITWFKNTSISSVENGRVVINVPNGFAKEWLENKYNLFILRALRNFQEEIKSVSCIISTQTKTVPPGNIDSAGNNLVKKEAPSHSQESCIGAIEKKRETNLNPRYTFESFIIGSSNELARAACFAVSQNPGKLYNPLFIYGGVGLGKTHLIQSIGNEIDKKTPNLTTKYITSERFTATLIDSIKNGKIAEFKDYYQKIDLLIIDDIQFISGKEKTQEEFFHIFNHLYQLEKQIVLSSDRPPKSIQILEERLKSRFEGGMIADIGKPDYETRLAILKKRALEKSVEIEENALDFIAQNIKNNVRELEGAFNRVAVSAQIDGKKINLGYASKTLSELISSNKKIGLSYNDIIKKVSSFYNINPEELSAKNRKREIVRPRQVAMYLMRTELQYSYPGIGEKLGKRDHTTAIHAYEKISKNLESDSKLIEEINSIREQLYFLS